LSYELFTWTMHGFSGEVKWNFRNRLPHALARLTICIVAIAVYYNNNDEKNNVILLPALLLLVSSMYLMYLTRVGIIGKVYIPAKNSMVGKVVLVTGANSGIGKETVRQLYHLGATIIMACRNEKKAQTAMKDILQSDDTNNRLVFLSLDLSDFTSVRAAATNVLNSHPKLDVLINNAGVMSSTQRTTVDNYELCMQANHLGHFLFTLLLMPLLLKSNARILNLTSSTYKLATHIGFDFDDPYCTKGRQYGLFQQYGMTKLCNILFTKELVRRNNKLVSYAIHPGVVRTEGITGNMNFFLKYGSMACGFFLMWVMKTSQQGAYSTVWLASTEDLPEPNGSYVSHCVIEPTIGKYVNDAEHAKKVWSWSEEQVKKWM